jgi:hypothetical protein
VALLARVVNPHTPSAERGTRQVDLPDFMGDKSCGGLKTANEARSAVQQYYLYLLNPDVQFKGHILTLDASCPN